MLYLWLVGYLDLAVKRGDEAAFFDACRRLSCTPKRVREDKKSGRTVCRFSTPCARELQKNAVSEGFGITALQAGGLPPLLGRLRRVPLLAAGLLLALFLLAFGRSVLWDIDILVEGELRHEEVEEALSASGLVRGAFLKNIDTDAVALAVRQSDARFAFVSVYLSGTVATVQVRARAVEPPEKSTAPANLVAKCDGIITLPLAFEGECLVREGEAVRRGQILVSGIRDTENNGIRISRAAGTILAKTVEQIEVFVPYQDSQKVKIGRAGYELFVKFFGKSRKVFKNSGNISNTCDIITSDISFTVGGRTLPFGLTCLTYEAYLWQPLLRTKEMAVANAKAQLAERLAAAVLDGTLLATTVVVEAREDGICLICTAEIERDIAETVELSVSENPEEGL